MDSVASSRAFVLAASLLFSLAVQAGAQSGDGALAPRATQEAGDAAQDAQPTTPRERREARRGELLSRMNLSPEQREQIRLIRQQTEQESRALMPRIRQARRALDRAIYLEDADESIVEARIKELAAAQAEALRLRTLAELKVRRVLTPAQLDILRELRRQGFNRQQRFNRRRPSRQRPDSAPLAPFERRSNRLPPSSGMNEANVEANVAGETPASIPAASPRQPRRARGLRRPRP